MTRTTLNNSAAEQVCALYTTGLTEAMVESLVSPVSSTPSQNVECSPRDSKHNKAPSAGLDEFSDENDALLGFEEDRVAIEHVGLKDAVISLRYLLD